ncbi:MAG: DUF5665 domain-containing protein [Pseudomonadota bacterium]
MDDVKRLADEVEKLNSHRFIRLQNSVPRMVAFQFVRGLAFGLGSVLGATLLVSLSVYFLGQIDLIPIIGDWAKQIVEEISIKPQNRQSLTDRTCT